MNGFEKRSAKKREEILWTYERRNIEKYFEKSNGCNALRNAPFSTIRTKLSKSRKNNPKEARML